MNLPQDEDVIIKEFKVVENRKKAPATTFFAKYKEQCIAREREVRAKSCACVLKDRHRMMAGLAPLNAPSCGCVTTPKRPLLFTLLLWIDKAKESNKQRIMAGLPGTDNQFYTKYAIGDIKWLYQSYLRDVWEWWANIIHMRWEEESVSRKTELAILSEQAKQKQRVVAEVKEMAQAALHDAQTAGIKFDRSLKEDYNNFKKEILEEKK